MSDAEEDRCEDVRREDESEAGSESALDYRTDTLLLTILQFIVDNTKNLCNSFNEHVFTF